MIIAVCASCLEGVQQHAHGEPPVPGGDAQRGDHAERGGLGGGGETGVDRADHGEEDQERRDEVG
jgi:hypothetical protein